MYTDNNMQEYKTGIVDFFNKLVKNQGLKLTIILWCLFGAYFVFYAVMNPGKHTVTPAYWQASLNWINSQNLYTGKGVGFLYLPQSAIMQIPFAIIPFTIAEPVWRIVNISLYAFSCYIVALLCRFMPIKKSFLIISLFSLPLAIDSARNGQINLTIATLLCITAYTLTHKKYTLSVIVCLIGFALKPYMVVPLLLICGVFPKRCLPSAVIGVLILFLFPFIFQVPDYVLHQYKEFLNTLEVAHTVAQRKDFASFFGMLNVFGVNIETSVQMFCSLILALATFFYSLYHSIKSPKEESSIIIISIAISFILLFSSRTENNTYCMIGPFIAYFFLRSIAMQENLRIINAIILILCYTAMAGSYEVGKLFTPDRAVWLAPLGLTVFICYTLLIIIPRIQRLSLTYNGTESLKNN